MDTNLKGKTFSYDQVRGILTAMLTTTGTVSKKGNNWVVEFERDIPGLDIEGREFSSIDQAVDTILPFFESNYPTLTNLKVA